MMSSLKRMGSRPKGPKDHVFEAGGMTDLISGTIVVDDANMLSAVIDEFCNMTLDSEGLELVAVKNDFHAESAPDQEHNLCSCIRLTVIVAPPKTCALLATIYLVLKRYDDLKQQIRVLDDIENGVYSKIGHATRKYLRSHPKAQFAAPLQAIKDVHVWEWMGGPALERYGYIDLPGEAELLKDATVDQGSVAMRQRSK